MLWAWRFSLLSLPSLPKIKGIRCQESRSTKAWPGSGAAGAGVLRVLVVSSPGVVLFSSGTRRAPTTGWWQGSRAATSSPCWIGNGSSTVVATARDVRIPAGEPGGQTQGLKMPGAGGTLWPQFLTSDKPGPSQTKLGTQRAAARR